jgi:hypothetical protein
MKFMLMMHVPGGQGDYQITAWKPEEIQAHMAFMHALNRELKKAGEFVAGEGLAPPGQAKLVRADKNGLPATDGPFAESKEFLAGFWIVDVDGPERAYAIAAKISTAPGPGGKPLIIPVEVRQVMSVDTRDG